MVDRMNDDDDLSFGLSRLMVYMITRPEFI